MKSAIVLLLFTSLSCVASTWYASATGSSTNGTIAAPWGMQYAVTNSNPHLAAGDTVLLLSGDYTCTETNTTASLGKVLEFRKSGTPEAKITYRSASLWGFSFNGGLLFWQSVSNIVLSGCRVYFSEITPRRVDAVYEVPSGITDYGQGNDILHNLIENTGHPGIASWSTTLGKSIQGNIIRFIGVNDYTGGYAGANRGSGMYLQNLDDSSEALIQGNISYYNYTTGMKAYGNTDIWGFRFYRNICTENSEAGIFYHNDNYGSAGVAVNTNFLWNNGTGVRIGYPLGNGGHSNAVVVGNYSVEEVGTRPFYMVDGWVDTTWTDNTGVNLFDRYVWLLEVGGETSGDIASHTLSGNSYYGVNTGGFGTGPFLIKEVSTSFDDWKTQTGGDADSTYTYGSPSQLVSYVFRPSTDTNFVHVAVFNWPTNETTEVNLSSFFNSGDILNIYDAQNIPVVASTVNYSNNVMVTLPLTLTNAATMLGEFQDVLNDWNGFDPRFRAFVVHKSGVWQAPPKKPRRNGPGRFRGM